MWLLGIAVIVLISYIIYVQHQMRKITKQLEGYVTEQHQQPISLQLINRDLNELVKQTNRLIMQHQRTKQLSKQEQLYYKEMISNISHDFRTPLTSIKGYQQLLAKGPLDAEQQQKLAVASTHVNNLESLLETFFEYSYLISQREQPIAEDVYMDVLLEEYVASHFTQFEQKGITITLDAPETTVKITSDERMLRRIVQNLMQNALQHSESNVEVRYWQTEHHTHITFSNQVELSQEFNPEQLFDRFYTIDRTRKKNSGLGLAIVRLLCETLGGAAHATVERNRLTFHIQLNNELTRKHGTT